MKTVLYVILIAVHTGVSLAQNPSPQNTAEEILESMADGAAEERELFPLAEELEYLRQHPVNIVTAQYSDLLAVPFISPMLAEAMVLLRDSVRIESLDQLRAVPLMTPELFQKISPYLTAEQPSPELPFFGVDPRSFASRTRWKRRLQPSYGFWSGKYAGDRNSLYQRIRVDGRNFDAGILLEKDAGERWGNRFTGGYFSLRDLFLVKKMVIGNYLFAADQGLVFAKNIASSKGTQTVSQSKRGASGITPALSTDEYRYFRGAAIRVGNDIASVTGLYSDRTMHANVDSSGTVTSFYTSGLFRTSGDLQKKNSLIERVKGARVESSIGRVITVGLNGVHISYDRRLSPSLYSIPSQNSISVGSIGGSSHMDGWTLYGETGTNDGERFSTVVGVILPFDRKFSVGFHHRALRKGFVNPLARPFSERAAAGDGEKGNYLALQAMLPSVDLAAYVDLYSLPSATGPFGSVGRDVLLSAQFRLINHFRFTLQVRMKTQWQTGIRNADDERNQANIRIGYVYEWNNRLTLAQRFESVRVVYAASGHDESGSLTFCEAKYVSRGNRWFAKGRLVYFDTDGFDARLYQFESDVAGSVSLPPLFGKGLRWYGVAGFDVVDGVRWSAKYAETKMFGNAVIGSGDDEIRGLLDNTVSVQLDFSF